MKRSFKEILGQSDPDMIGYAVDSMKDYGVSEDTLARIRNRVTGSVVGNDKLNDPAKNTSNQKRSTLKKWIPVFSAAACLVIVVGVVLGIGILGQASTVVLEVRNEQLNGDELNHTNDVEGEPVVSVEDQKKGDKKTVRFGNKQYDLEYKDTIAYVIGEVRVDEYVSTDNNNPGTVLLLPDGEIYAMLLSSVGQIDIETTADELTVKQAVEACLKDELDFDSFEYCDVTCSLQDISDGFGLYSFVWYNKVGDIWTDQTLNLCVTQNGEISALWMKYRSKTGFEGVSDSISIDDFQEKIADKVSSIYGDGLIGYSVFSSVLTHFDGKLYLDCTIAVKYLGKNAEELSEACRLLVPVE